jgi:hypothetical protein
MNPRLSGAPPAWSALHCGDAQPGECNPRWVNTRAPTLAVPDSSHQILIFTSFKRSSLMTDSPQPRFETAGGDEKERNHESRNSACCHCMFLCRGAALFSRRWLDRDVGEAPCASQAASWVDCKRF